MEDSLSLSVIICSHNPNHAYLSRVLDALKAQTLSKNNWEMLLIDNASRKPLKEAFSLSWHPLGRHLSVLRLGKTHALVEGIREARARILVIVDDDNVLSPEYLQNLLVAFDQHPLLGVVGGLIEGSFEVTPPKWAEPYLLYLAIIDLGEESFYYYSHRDHTYVPPGAGMGILKTVAEYYAQQIATDPIRQGFDPVGKRISRCGDTDMALCVFDMGLGMGYCPSLKLKHLMPKERLQSGYFQRLMEGGEYSITLLRLIRGYINPENVPPVWRRRLSDLKWRVRNRSAGPAELIERARERGRSDAYSYYLTMRSSSKSHKM
jgi:glycosyl transferase family 2